MFVLCWYYREKVQYIFKNLRLLLIFIFDSEISENNEVLQKLYIHYLVEKGKNG